MMPLFPRSNCGGSVPGSSLPGRSTAMDDEDLAGLIERAKSGDEQAIHDLLRRFEGEVRMVVRARLPRALRSQFDSMDFVQAVWKSVFTGPDRDLRRFENVQHLRGFL